MKKRNIKIYIDGAKLDEIKNFKEYDGFTFNLNEDETEGFFIDLLDSLKNEFNPIESSNSYTTTLVPSIYSSISYLHRKSEIGIFKIILSVILIIKFGNILTRG